MATQQKFFELIPPDTNINFVGLLRPAIILSLVAVVASLVLLVVPGPKLGIDFAGGSLVQVRFSSEKQADEVRAAAQGAGLPELDVQDFGTDHRDFLFRVPLSENETGDAVNQRLVDALQKAFPGDQSEILRVEAVGPRVGDELRQKAVLSVILATLLIGLYIWARFEWRFAVGTGAAILHDVIIVVGFLIIFGYEFDLTIVASLLTVVGFSVNDKVVVSDRIRENRHRDQKSPLDRLINTSINETLGRTIVTNGTTFLAALALFLFGGDVLHGFAFAIVVGSIIGTYSSVYISSSTVLLFERQELAPVATTAARAK